MITTIFQSLEGSWTFQRTIHNGTASGVARFTRQKPFEFLYREDGVMTLAGSSHTFYKEYLYRQEDNTISIFFNEMIPRLFQRLTFDKKETYPIEAQGGHLCKCDQYTATYRFMHPKEFSLEQRVLGPEKKFSITTFFQKMDEPL